MYRLVVTVVSALGVFLCLKLLQPLVSYTYWSAICWPLDGLLVGVLLLRRRTDWPWILLGYLVAFIPIQILDHVPAPLIVADAACNLFEIGFAAYCVPAFSNMLEWLRQPRLIERFSFLAIIAAPFVPALCFCGFAYLYAHWKFWSGFLRWICGDALGIALFTPLVLVLFSRETYRMFRSEERKKTLSSLAFLFGASWFTFHLNGYPIAFLPFPVLVFVVNRIGFPGAVLSVNILTIIAATATIDGNGPFMLGNGGHEANRMFELQVYLILAMVMSFAIALTTLERNRFEEQLTLALQKMETLATQDALTGLGNRRLFDLTLASEWARACRDGKPIALLLLDVDCFKSYNDMYGHIAGDECLSTLAAKVRATVRRSSDLVARYGGEEFVVLLPGLVLDQASKLAESIRRDVESMQLEHKGNQDQFVTISIGCCSMVPYQNFPSQILVKAADEALYEAKQSGRNRVVCAASEPVLAKLAPTGTL